MADSTMPDPVPTTRDKLSQGAQDLSIASARVRAFLALASGRELAPDEKEAVMSFFDAVEELAEHFFKYTRSPDQS